MKPLQPFNIDFSGINLVEASAGTGKTYNITSLYIRALIELNLSVSQLLVVTYTEAATKELKDRLLKRMRESMEVLKGNREAGEDQFLSELAKNVGDHRQAIDRLSKAVRSFDEAAVYTIHGFCYQVLQEQAFESRALYDAELIGDDSDLVLEAIDDYWRNWVKEASENIPKRPLLKLLTDRKCYPENLVQELSPYLGKPYMKILPEEFEFGDLNELLQSFRATFRRMEEMWEISRNELFQLLNKGTLKYYGEKSLKKWFVKMDEFLAYDIPPIGTFAPFTKKEFGKFIQSEIDGSLKKAEIKKGTVAPQHEFFKQAEEFGKSSNQLRAFDSKFKKDLLLYLRKELNERKEKLQVLSYDDLLLKLRDALQNEEHGKKLAQKLNTKYPIALVDEFQDTDPAQYEIFRSIYEPYRKKSALFMIGDPKQSIYSFRGADVFAYLKAKKDADPQKIFSLGYNFRSTPELISGLNTLYGNHQNPFILGNIPFTCVKAGNKHEGNRLLENGDILPPIRFHKLNEGEDKPAGKGASETKAAKDTAQEIKRLIQGGQAGQITIGSESLKARDIAVLVQTHKQAGMVSKALQEEKIKSVQYSQESVFQSDEARELQIVLKAIADPSNERFIKTAIAVSLIKFSAVQLIELEEDEARWLEVLEQFLTWHKQWQQKGFQFMFRSFLKEAKVYEQLIKNVDGERRLTNVFHLGELLQDEDRRRKGGPRGLLKWLARKRKEDTSEQEEAQLRLESDEELVKIITMHRSKGLEYPVVFCPFLWKGPQFSDYGRPLEYHGESSGQTLLDFNGKSDGERNQKRFIVAKEDLAEQMRLAYVAMTRAEHRCYLTWAYAKRSEFSPLGYLLLGPERVFPLLKNVISKKKPKKMGGKEIDGVLDELCGAQPEFFSLDKASELPLNENKLKVNGVSQQLKVRSFHRASLEVADKVSSFSSITAGKDDDYLPDYDQLIESADEQSMDSLKTIFTFPKGAQAGTCIHQIFEEIDFGNIEDTDRVVKHSLEAHGISLEWKEVVTQMLKTTVNKSLLPNSDLKLSNLASVDFIPELEFYYQSKVVHLQKLISIIRKDNRTDGFINGMSEVGFLKGFIDLTFKFGGKFYLLDYKTNFLGDCRADYTPDKLQVEMYEKFYDLQYHIYIIALHRYLKKRMAGYSYEENFGGAFYLFLRGICEEGQNGIYFDCPDLSVIENLNKYILEGDQE